MKVNLVLLKVGGNNKAILLPSTVTTLGRRQDCDLCVPLKVISRRHCEFNMDDGELSVRDLDSSNGTFVNGLLIDEADLKAGDKISVGPLNFIVQIDGVPVEFPSDEALDGQLDLQDEVKSQDQEANVADSCSLPKSKQDMHNTEIIDTP